MTLLNKSLALNLNAIKDMSPFHGDVILCPRFSLAHIPVTGEKIFGDRVSRPHFTHHQSVNFLLYLPLIISF